MHDFNWSLNTRIFTPYIQIFSDVLRNRIERDAEVRLEPDPKTIELFFKNNFIIDVPLGSKYVPEMFIIQSKF